MTAIPVDSADNTTDNIDGINSNRQNTPNIPTAGVNVETMGFTFTPADRFVEQRLLVPLQLTQDGSLATPANYVGVLFLDRTRVRPVGFCPGEHITTISLAPGEELAVEQKSFSKREVTYEEVNDTERQFDLELSSTLSNSIEEGLSLAEQHNASSGWNVSGNLSGEYKGVKVGVSGGYSSSISDADQKSRNRSATDSFTASRKVASKYRTQHKTTFRIVTEQRFEATSKRILRNPNRYTPIDLHYFKVLQRLRMTQERYGVRLCWAPFIEDPGLAVRKRLEAQRQVLQQKYNPIPDPELPPPVAPPTRGPKEEASSLFTVKDDIAPSGSISKNYALEVNPPRNYEWDRDEQYIKDNLYKNFIGSITGRNPDAYVIGYPFINEAGKVQVTVHVSAEDGHIPIVGGNVGEIDIQMKARFVAIPDQADKDYEAAYRDWQNKDAERQVKNLQDITKANEKIKEESDIYEENTWKNLNGINELLNRLISTLWQQDRHDEANEVNLWEQLFEWETASFDLYPGWWSNQELRDPLVGPNEFRNASWARVYLPLRPGREAEALEFIFTNGDPSKLDPTINEIIGKMLTELKVYRLQSFGTETGDPVLIPSFGGGPPTIFNEKVITLGHWEELVPTDGTHCEVTVALTTGADALTRDELDRANRLRGES